MYFLRSVAFTAVLYICSSAEESYWFSDEFIDSINAENSTWTAGRNFHKDTPLGEVKWLLGLNELDITEEIPEKQHDTSVIDNLPESFDARDKWPFCKSLSDILDQGSCGSCWAISATAAMTDRICIHSKGRKKVEISTQDLTSCCSFANGYHSDGCFGGTLQDPWKFWEKQGVVSGGPYNSSEGCRPYEIEPCEHHVSGPRIPCHEPKSTPPCVESCTISGIDYKTDKNFGQSSYVLKGEEQIKAELYKNGPVVGGFSVYADFLQYKSGVYERKKGEFLGGHAVKLLGWGVEKGTKYWLVANSWNTDWGDKGYFKIKRGVNTCGIDAGAVAGLPKL